MNAAINPVEAVAAIPATPAEVFVASLPLDQIETLREIIARNARGELLNVCDTRASQCKSLAPPAAADPQSKAVGGVGTKSAELPTGEVALPDASLVGSDSLVLPSGWSRDARYPLKINYMLPWSETRDLKIRVFMLYVWPKALGRWGWNNKTSSGDASSMLLAMCGALGIGISPFDSGWLSAADHGNGVTTRIHTNTADGCARAALEAFHAAQTKLPAPIVEPAASAPPRSSAEQSTIGAGAVSKDELRMARTQRLATRALEHFGVDNQIDKLLEEMAELQVALCHYRDGKASTREVIGELADVSFVLAQLQETFGYSDVLEVMHAKADALETIMNAAPPVPGADGEARWVKRIKELEAQLAQARAVIR